MISVGALTTGRNAPSSRFRIQQYVFHLYRHGVNVQLRHSWPSRDGTALSYKLKKTGLRYKLTKRMENALSVSHRIAQLRSANRHDLLWVNKSFAPGRWNLSDLAKPPFILDVDDATWIKNKHISKVARRAAATIAGNSYIASYFRQYCSNVYVVPTAIDIERFVPLIQRQSSRKKDFIVAWTGTSHTLHFVYEIESQLSAFLKKYKTAILRIICNQRPHFQKIPMDRVQFIKWSSVIENTAIQDADVGIMPLTDDEWSRGKCSCKLLQYMAVGIPAVASYVGMNKEIYDSGDVGIPVDAHCSFFDALEFLILNPGTANQKGTNGRRSVEQHFNAQIISYELSKIFNNTLSSTAEV